MVNTKRLITPIISIGVGFLTFMFMIMNYFAAELVGRRGSSAYESIGDFFELNDRFSNIDGAFLTIFTAILLIFLIIMAIVLLAVGALGLVKEFTKFDLFADPNKLTSISNLTLKIYLIIDMSAAVFYVVFCAVNKFYYYIPGLGVWFLVALGIGGVVANNILTTKYAAEIADNSTISFRCSSCGAPAKASEKFCSKCGSPVLARRSDPAPEFYCSACHSRAKAGEKFCSKCGSPVVMSQPTSMAYRCSSCAAPARAGEKFCSKCGGSVIAVRNESSAACRCPACGAAAKPGDKFCPNCGATIKS